MESQYFQCQHLDSDRVIIWNVACWPTLWKTHSKSIARKLLRLFAFLAGTGATALANQPHCDNRNVPRNTINGVCTNERFEIRLLRVRAKLNQGLSKLLAGLNIGQE